jgi:hypothetical protein
MHTLSNSSGSEAAVQVFIDSLLLSDFLLPCLRCLRLTRKPSTQFHDPLKIFELT